MTQYCEGPGVVECSLGEDWYFRLLIQTCLYHAYDINVLLWCWYHQTLSGEVARQTPIFVDWKRNKTEDQTKS